MNKKKSDNIDLLVTNIVSGMQEMKAKDIKVLDLRNLNSRFTDFFVICHGTSDRHVAAVSDNVERVVFEKMKEHPWNVEANNIKDWVLFDYIDVVVHFFTAEKRYFYAIEELWGDAEITEFEDVN